jgi:hypothetical protein
MVAEARLATSKVIGTLDEFEDGWPCLGAGSNALPVENGEKALGENMLIATTHRVH